MSGIRTENRKNLMLFSGRAHPQLAAEVAKELGVEPVPTSAYDFANGEIFVRFEESVRGSQPPMPRHRAAPQPETPRLHEPPQYTHRQPPPPPRPLHQKPHQPGSQKP